MTTYNEVAEILKALAHPVRLCIVHGLTMTKSKKNVTQMQNCLKIPQSTLSQQLGILRNKGIIKAERHGVQMHYKIANDRITAVVKDLCKSIDGKFS